MASISVLTSMRLASALLLDNDTGAFPSNPQVGSMTIKDGTLHAYLNLNQITSWYPLVRLPERYVHNQTAPVTQFVVEHNLNTTEVWYQIQDTNGQLIVPADFVAIDNNSFQLVFLEPVQCKVLVLATGVQGEGNSNPSLGSIQGWPAAVSTTEVGYLDGVTSSIQAQLNALAASSGGASSLAELTDWPSTVSATEVGYLDGVTSAVQIQLDAKQTAAQVDARIQTVVGAAPAALDTLAEIAAQLQADETAAAALTNTVSLKADKTYVDNNLAALNASNLTTGTVPTARLGTGSPTSSTYLRGDGTWSTITQAAAGSSGEVQFSLGGVLTTSTNFTWDHLTDTFFATNVTGNGSGLTALNASNLDSGTVPTARLGTGTANATTYLRGDGTWATVAGGGGGGTSLSGTGWFGTFNATTGTYGGANTTAGQPWLIQTNMSAGANQKVWLQYVDASGILHYDLVNDAGSAQSSWMTVGRSGNSVTAVTVHATAVQMNAAVTATSFSGAGTGLTDLNASNLGSGTVPPARLGSGTADATSYLRGDGTWAQLSGTSTSVSATGALSVNGGTTGTFVYVSASRPYTTWVNTAAGAGLKVSDFYVGSDGTLNWRLVADGNGAAANWMTVSRSGNTATNVSLTATALTFSGSFVNSLIPTTDNLRTLGSASFRWSTVYAGTGTINTSDRNLKQDIAELDDSEKLVALHLKGMIRKYRFKDAVAEKGDAARVHVGIIAQDVQDAFIAEGLDPDHYGVLCIDTWTDDAGETHTRLGVRYDELFAFIISVL